MNILSKLMVVTGFAFALYGFLGYYITIDFRGIGDTILYYENGAGYKIDPSEIVGDWVGSYERKKVGMTFYSDSVQIDYQGDVRKIPYSIKSDTLFIPSDTGRIIVLNRDILSVRPLNEFEEDVNIIFLLDFRRVQ